MHAIKHTEQMRTISFVLHLWQNNMLQFLLVALLVAGTLGEAPKAAEPVAQPDEHVKTVSDAESAEGRAPGYRGHRDENLYLQAKLDGHKPEGPLVARNLPSDAGHRPDIAAQDEIIKFVYSPAYYEPVWLLDYRFLKSGGRRYTRGPGGQILILPKSYHHHKGDGTGDYDSMIEHLRLKLIAEQNQRNREHRTEHERRPEHGPRREHIHEYEHDRLPVRHGYREEEDIDRHEERRAHINPYH